MTLLFYKLLRIMIIFAAPIASMSLIIDGMPFSLDSLGQAVTSEGALETSASESPSSQAVVRRVFNHGEAEPSGVLPDI
ncbi:uncharacterized protein ARMOST_14566 [Armillaria ostoyae]|uniref:Uncharacterized protein n=1 Tax=Armillaria ostoyae TaxID=47428 RepID=A0A284RQZ6_ARMOS|nr:uncharacterized protein ARMOST_14566 [Armillaria ostoyae]